MLFAIVTGTRPDALIMPERGRDREREGEGSRICRMQLGAGIYADNIYYELEVRRTRDAQDAAGEGAKRGLQGEAGGGT